MKSNNKIFLNYPFKNDKRSIKIDNARKIEFQPVIFVVYITSYVRALFPPTFFIPHNHFHFFYFY